MIGITDELIDTSLIITRSIFKNNFSDIQKVKLCWHHLKYISFSVMNYLRIQNDKNSSDCKINVILTKMNKLGLFPDNSLQFFLEHEIFIESSIVEIISTNVKDIRNMNLSLLHEYLMSFDLKISLNNIDVIVGKNAKDIAGAYYTPSELANAVVKEAFEKYERDYANIVIQNIILSEEKSTKSHKESVYQNISIADLSCGGGEFFRSAQQYLLEKHSIPLHQSSKFFWGIDVDPIALQITICDLLSFSSTDDWQTIISHFILGNPLVNTSEESTFSEKSELFALGQIYSTGMGLNFNSNLALMRFDIVVGNPPWEKIRFEERKFFANIYPEISAIPQKDMRHIAILKLKDAWPAVYRLAMESYNDYKCMNSRTYRHPLIEMSAAGELNTYALFTELAFELTKPSGICSLIVKSSLITSPVNTRFWNKLSKGGFIHSVCLFVNKQKIFNIDSREKFCVITLSHKIAANFSFAAGLQTAEEMIHNIRSKVTYDDLINVNPFTGMLPNVAKTEDMQVLLDAHKQLPLFETVYPDCHYGRLIHLTAHSKHIDTEATDDNLPIYEGKFIEQYDARFSTFATLDDKKRYASKALALKNIDFGKGKPKPECRYFVQKSFWSKYTELYPEQFSLCWRSLTSTTNARTTIAMILPTFPTCQSIQLLQLKNERQLLLLLGLLNSIPFDYFVRLKMPGLDLTQSVIKQVPVPLEEDYNQSILFKGHNTTIEQHIFSRMYHMLRNESLVQVLLTRINYPIYSIDIENCEEVEVKKELDYLFAKAYGFNDDIFKEILTTFPKY